MTNIVIATHGNFGEELLKSAEMIIGKVTNVYTLSLLPDMSFEEFVQNSKELFENFQDEIICLVDLFGGTPSNVMLVLTKEYSNQVITGLNLPMFIELYLSLNNHKEANDLATEAVNNGKESIVFASNQM